MGVLNTIWEGVCSVGKGLIDIISGLFELAFTLAVYVIAGIYSAVESMVNYVFRALKRIQKTRPKTKIGSTSILGPKALKNFLDNVEHVQGDTIDLSTAVKEARTELETGKVSGWQIIEGIDENGEEAILDVERVQASGGFSEEIKNADKSGKIYSRPIAV